MLIHNRFRKFGGKGIPDVIQYLHEYVTLNPNVTISVGCDSLQKRKKTTYAITIMMYNVDERNGAHVIFFRESVPKIRDTFDRLSKEAEYVHKVADFLHENLKDIYKRTDLTEFQRRKYKYHTLKCNGEYGHVLDMNEEGVITNLSLTEADRVFEFNLVDIHLDFNPKEGFIDKKGMAKNRSHLSYKAYVPWLRSIGYRVFTKPSAFAASYAADLLVK